MEERIIDQDELRKVRITRKKGAQDVEDDTLPEPQDEGQDEGQDEAYSLAFEGEAFDESLIGLTNEQIQMELARRERAARAVEEAYATLCDKGDELLAAQAWEQAAAQYGAAQQMAPEQERAAHGRMAAITQNYSTAKVFETPAGADAFMEAAPSARAKVLEVFGQSMQTSHDAYIAEANALRKTVEEGIATRRAPFRAHRNYYLVRLAVICAVFALLAIGAGVSAAFLLRVPTTTPLILTCAFGGAAAIVFAVAAVYAHKSLRAARLCRLNEMLSSTEEGKRVLALEDAAQTLFDVLHSEDEDGEDEAEGLPA